MVDKLKCYFCGEELVTNMLNALVCPTQGCIGNKVMAPKEIWQALIDGKKAQDALKVARNLYQELALAYCEMVDDYRTTYGCLKTPEQETQEYMQEYDEKITSITKQE